MSGKSLWKVLATRVAASLRLLADQRLLPDELAGARVDHVRPQLLGQLLLQLRVEDPQRHSHLLPDLVGRPKRRQRQPPLAKLLRPRQVPHLLYPVRVEDPLPGIEPPPP